jgi:hypothetical protein
MKHLLIIALTTFAISIYGQETPFAFDAHKLEAPYHLPIPQNWGVERFPIPISFAPGIPYTGVEDLRFAPGWGNSLHDDYWSYAFLWHLNGDVKLDAKSIESHLHAYYSGLISNNAPGIPAEKLSPIIAAFKDTKKSKGDTRTFVGTIQMTDYMQQKPITLHCKVHVISCTGLSNTFIFFQLSPQPFSHDVWQSLDQLWTDFRCQKK